MGIAVISAGALSNLLQGPKGFNQVTGKNPDEELAIGSQQEALDLNGRLLFASKKRPAGMGIFARMILDFGRCAQACRSPLPESCNSLGYSLLPPEQQERRHEVKLLYEVPTGSVCSQPMSAFKNRQSASTGTIKRTDSLRGTLVAVGQHSRQVCTPP